MQHTKVILLVFLIFRIWKHIWAAFFSFKTQAFSQGIIWPLSSTTIWFCFLPLFCPPNSASYCANFSYSKAWMNNTAPQSFAQSPEARQRTIGYLPRILRAYSTQSLLFVYTVIWLEQETDVQVYAVTAGYLLRTSQCTTSHCIVNLLCRKALGWVTKDLW